MRFLNLINVSKAKGTPNGVPFLYIKEVTYLQAGDVVFIRGKGVVAKAVQLYDKGRFSHVAIAVSDTHILEADWYIKVHITPLQYTDYEIVPLDLTPEQRDLLVHRAIQLIGKWYDYFEIAGILLKDRRHFDDPNAFICTEAVIRLLCEIDYLPNGYFTPNELYSFLKEFSK